MVEQERERSRRALWNTVGVLLVTVAGIYVARVLFPLLLGAVAAVLLDPVVSAAARRGLPRGVVALVLLIALGGGTIAVAGFGLTRLSAELGSLVESGWGEEGLRRLQASWGDLERLLRGEPARQSLGALAGWALSAVKAVPGVAVAVVISLLSAYLLLRDKERLVAAGVRLLPRSLRSGGTRAGQEVAESLAGIIRAELLLAVLTGALAVGGLSLAGVGYAWLLGLAAALLDLVPMVGPSGVFLPVALYLAAVGEPGKAVAVLAVAAVAAVVRQVLEPRLLSAGTGLHPLAMLVAVYAGFRLFGPFGLVAGPLAAAVFAALFRVAVAPLLDEA